MSNRSSGGGQDGQSGGAMSDKINVAIRVRPLINRETHGGFKRSNWKTQNADCIYQVDAGGKMVGNPYSFDVLFEQDKTNGDIFEKIAVPIVDACLAGFHGTIFAYGQTSSGKTYTMSGTGSEPGLIPRSVHRIFNYIEQTYEREFLLRVSYMEIYNEKICDLLAKEQKQLAIKENYDGQLYVQHLEEIAVTSQDQLLALMRHGDLNRRTGETNMNERSSRSHSIFRLVIESQERGGDGSAVKVSHFNLVDLAGSERVSQTGATGERLREGCHINKSLSTLCLVIYKLSIGEDFVNYRDSKLTRILQGALGGNSRTSIICTVTPASVEETHSTLKFATNAKAIKNKPIVNEVLSDAAQLKRYESQINRLKMQLNDQSSGKSESEWKAMQEEIERKDEEKRALAEKIEKLQREMLVSQMPAPGEGFRQKAKRRETCCIGMLPKKNLLSAATTDDFDFKKPKSILPPHSVRESREEFVSPDVAFASLPSSPHSAPLSRRLSLSPPRGRRGVVVFDPVVRSMSPDARVPGQCDCGIRLDEYEIELEELREKCENLQSVNEMMVLEMETKQDFSMMEKDDRFMSPRPSMLLSPAPNRQRSLARTLLSPAARMCASPRTSRLSRLVSPTTASLKEQLEEAIMERDEARKEIEDLKSFLGVDLDVSHDPNRTTTDPETLRQQRNKARESLANKKEMLEEAHVVMEVLKEGLETCQGSLQEAEQKDRATFQKTIEELQNERDRLLERVAELVKETEILKGERDVLQEAQDSSGSRRRQHEVERDRMSSEIEALKSQLEENTSSSNTEYEQQLNEVLEMKAKLEEQIQELLETKTGLENRLETEKNTQEEQKTNLEAERNSLVGEKNSFETEKKTLGDEKNILIEEKASLQVEKRNLEEENNRLQTEKTDLEEKKVHLEDELHTLKESQEQLMQILDEKEAEFEVERAEFQTVRAEFQTVRAEFEMKGAEFEAKGAEFETERAEFQSKMTELETEKVEMSEKVELLEQFKTEVLNDKALIAELGSSHASALKEVEELKSSLEKELAKVTDLQAQITQLESQNRELKEHCENATLNSSEYTEKLLHEKEEVEKQVLEMREENTTLQAQISELQLERENFEKQVLELVEEKKVTFEQRISELSEEKETFEKLICDLQTDNENLELQCAELSNEKETADKRFTELNSEKELFEKEVSELCSEKEQYERRFSEMNSEKELFERQISEFNSEKELFQNTLLEITNQKELFEKHCADFERERDSLISQNVEMGKSCEEWKMQVEVLENSCEELKKRIEELQQLQTQEADEKVETLQKRVTDLEAAAEAHRSEVEGLETVTAELTARVQEEATESEALRQRLVETDARVQELEGVRTELTQATEQLEEECTKQQTLIAAGRKELARLEGVCDALDAELNEKVEESEASLAELRTQLSDYERIRDELETELNTEKEKVAQLEEGLSDSSQEAVQKLRENEEVVADLRTELVRVEKICDDLDAELSAEQEKVAGLDLQLQQEKEKVSALTEELSQRQENLALLNQELSLEQEKSSELEKHVDELTEKCQGLEQQLEEMGESGSEKQEVVEAQRTEIVRLEKICDELEAELEQEQAKTDALNDEKAKHMETENSLECQLQEHEALISRLTSELDQVSARSGNSDELSEKVTSLTEEVAENKVVVEAQRTEIDRLEKICDELEAELEQEQEKSNALGEEKRLRGMNDGGEDSAKDKMKLEECQKEIQRLSSELAQALTKTATLNGGDQSAELEARVATLEGEAEETKLCVEAQRTEIARLEKICDELEAELDQEQEKTNALEKQVTERGGQVVLPAADDTSKEVQALKREISVKDLKITRHLSEEKRLRTVLDKARQDLVAERKRSESLHDRLQAQIAVGGDGEHSQEKLLAIENKYKSSLDDKTREVMRLKSEIRRLSQLQDQTIVSQPEKKPAHKQSSKPGAPCTGSGVTDDIALYTLEAKNSHLEREMKKMKTENGNLKSKLRDVTQKLTEAFTDMYRWKDRAEELERTTAAAATGDGKENAPRTPAQAHFLSKAHANPNSTLYDFLPEDGEQPEPAPAKTDSPDNCKTS